MNQIRKRLRSTIFAFDLFGHPINLMMKNQHMYHTIPGTLVSVGILIFTFFSFLSLLLEMLEGLNPNVVSTTTFTKDPEPYQLTPENFRIGITVADTYGQVITNYPEKTFYRIKIKLIEVITETKGQGIQNTKSETNSYLIPCTQTDHGPFVKSLDLGFGVDQVNYCIDDLWWKDHPILMRGTAMTFAFNYATISIYTCQNSTDPNDALAPICAPQEEIDQQMYEGFVAFSFVDQQLDQKKVKPFSPVYKLQYFQYNLKGNMKYAMYYLRHTIMNSITNPFYYWGKKMIDHVLQYNRHEQTSDLTIVGGEIVRIQLFLDEQKVEYFRSYGNILTVFGSISGLLGALKAICSFVLIPLAENLMNITIIEAIFSFPTKKEEGNNIVKSQRITRKETLKTTFQKLTSRKLTSVIDPKEIVQKESPIKRFLRFKDRGLKIEGCIDHLVTFIAGMKKQLIQQGVEKYQQKLDVIFIIRKLIEVDKLKALLLTQNQIRLFDYIPKPTIKLALETKPSQVSPTNQAVQEEIDFFMDYKPLEVQVAEAMQAYEQIHEERNMEPMNYKLISMMDKEIKSAFHEAMQQNKSQDQNQLGSPSQSLQQQFVGKITSYKDPLEEFDQIISNREG